MIVPPFAWTPRYEVFFRRLTIVGGLVWVGEGLADVVQGNWVWGLAQIVVGVVFVLGSRRYWERITEKERRRRENS